MNERKPRALYTGERIIFHDVVLHSNYVTKSQFLGFCLRITKKKIINNKIFKYTLESTNCYSNSTLYTIIIFHCGAITTANIINTFEIVCLSRCKQT